MASVSKAHNTNYYSIKIKFKGKETECSLRCLDRSVADAVCKKINKIEEAVRLALTPEDIGLGKWVESVRENFPPLYSAMEKCGLFADDFNELEGIISCEESCESANSAPLKEYGEKESVKELPEIFGGVRLWKIKQVAELLGETYNSVHGMIKRGELKAFYLGSCLRIRESDLEEFVKNYNGDMPEKRRRNRQREQEKRQAANVDQKED